ncbi:MAG: phage shock protein operon transcriptional activator [Verrucomicrobiota bacterium]
MNEFESDITHVEVQEALGQSPAFLEFQERLSRVARVDRPVLIIGERGTGKELAAAKLHFLSRRWEGPLIALNCATLSPTLVESELFGHESGAFTGAAKRRIGRFESANEGTLFLDEIAVIPLPVQEKILRVVEYATFERVGSSSPLKSDVRIIGATNADLKQMARDGDFMSDLLDRLSFEVLFVPPLRERGEDILLLARHFASKMAFELGRDEIPEFADEAAGQLLDYAWPGNIRELKNVIERAVYRSDLNTIETIAFDPFESPYQSAPTPRETPAPPSPDASADTAPDSFTDAVRQHEIDLLAQALKLSRYNQRAAAKRLALTYHQFRGLYRKYHTELSPQT